MKVFEAVDREVRLYPARQVAGKGGDLFEWGPRARLLGAKEDDEAQPQGCLEGVDHLYAGSRKVASREVGGLVGPAELRGYLNGKYGLSLFHEGRKRVDELPGGGLRRGGEVLRPSQDGVVGVGVDIEEIAPGPIPQAQGEGNNADGVPLIGFSRQVRGAVRHDLQAGFLPCCLSVSAVSPACNRTWRADSPVSRHPIPSMHP